MRRLLWLVFGLLFMQRGALDMAQGAQLGSLEVVDASPSRVTQLAPRQPVTFHFNRRVDCEDANAAFGLTPQIKGELSCDEYSLTFAPKQDYQPETTYTFELNPPLRATDGAPLVDSARMTWRSASPLAVSETFPNADAILAPVDSDIIVVFDRPVAPLQLSADASDLPMPLSLSPAVDGSGEWVNSAVYVFSPAAPLQGSARYTATVAGAQAVDGSALESPFSWTFQTAPPRIVSVNPPVGADDLILNPRVQVRFDQRLSQEVAERAFRFEAQPNSDHPDIAGSFEWADDGMGFAYLPERLKLDTAYQAAFDRDMLPGLRLASNLTAPRWRYRTVPAPKIIETSPQDGERDAHSWGVSLFFASPMDIESLAGKVSIEPSSAQPPDTHYGDWNNRWQVAFDAEPNTAYRITIAPGMTDIYGNAITEPLVIRYRTAARPPEIGFAGHGDISFHSAYQPARLALHQRGVEHVDLALHRIDLDAFVARMTNPEVWSPAQEFQPPTDSLMESWRFAGSADGKRQDHIAMLADEGLAPGIYFAEITAPGLDTQWSNTRQFLNVSTVALSMKQSADSLLVWAVDVGTGLPLTGETVRVFGEGSALVGTGNTDADGLARIALSDSLPDFARLAVVLDSGEHFGFGMTSWTDGMMPWDFGIEPGFYQGKRPVYVYTDRPVYRGGQTVYFRGLARVKDDVRYTPPDMDSLSVSIRDSQYDIIGEMELPLGETGSFHGEFDLPADAMPGAWTLLAKLPTDGEHQEDGYIDFQVAEYRLPEFQVSLTTEAPQIVQGDTADFAIEGKYYFGGAVSDSPASYSVVSRGYDFAYSGDGDYDFGEREPLQFGWSPFDYDEGLVDEGELRTDAAGMARFELAGDLGDARGSRRYMIDASISDESGQAIYTQGSLVLHQGLLYIGARADDAVGRAGDSSRINLIAVDWDSQPIADQPIDVELVERRWTSEQTQDPITGRVETTWRMEEVPVEYGKRVTDADGKASFDFLPESAGRYKILSKTTDSAGNEVTTTTYPWISGEGYIPWWAGSNQDDRQIDLVPGKRAYQVGDKAKILITSAYAAETQALITIERGNILNEEIATVRGSSHLYEFDVLPEHAPNIYVSALLMRAADAQSPASWRMGVVELEVDHERYALDIDIRPDRRWASPQDTVRYDLHVRDYRGGPVAAEVGLALTDLAALSLAGRKSPRLLDHFYGAQPLSVQSSTSLLRNSPEMRAVMESAAMADQCCFGGGGGFGDPGVIDLRQEFIDTPYWNPLLLTNADGEANFETRLPDNLTTWRLDARAWADAKGRLLVGENTADMLSTLPLVLRPVTPRFFVVGDSVKLAAVVNNNTDSPVNVAVSLEQLAGLELAEGESQTQSIAIPAQGRGRVWWQVTVKDVDSVAPVFVVRSDDGAFSDASISPASEDESGALPVYQYAAPETVGTAGMLREAGTRVEALRLPDDLDLRKGGLDIRIQKSLAGALLDSLDALEHEVWRTWDCAASVVSRLLPNLAAYRALTQLDIADDGRIGKLDSAITASLVALRERQNNDGGWSWCDGNESDTLTTALRPLRIVAGAASRLPRRERVHRQSAAICPAAS